MRKTKVWGRLFLFLYLLAFIAAGIAPAEAMTGTVEGVGTHFEITDSSYLNISVDSTVSVNMDITSVPGLIAYSISPADPADISTTLTITGLEAGTTYYLLQDGTNGYVEIAADGAGQVSYTQDLSAAHYVNIFQTPQDMTLPQMPEEMTGEGTHFAITNSEYLNVTVDSTETIKITMSSISNTITMNIAPGTAATSTQLTIGSLLPGTTYYKYEDDLHNGIAFTTDATGSYTYTQDLTMSHHVMIFTHHSTKFITDDATGGDCTAIGTWDAATKTCTLSMDLTETVEIDSDGITLDGNGHSITGNGTGYGVYGWHRSYLTIENLTISGFTYGVYLEYHNWDYFNNPPYSLWTQSNTITGNTVSNCQYGIMVAQWSNDTVITNNTVTGRIYGIAVTNGRTLRVENNYIDSNGGIYGAYFNWITLSVVHNLFINARVQGVDAVYGVYGDVAYNTFQNNGVGTSFTYYTWVAFQSNNYIDNVGQTQEYPAGYGRNYYDNNYWNDFDTPEEGCYDTNADGYCDASREIKDYWGNVVLYDSHPRTQPVASAYPNTPPVAVAGPDQTVECVSYSATPVMLDGSGSSDPDGDALTYSWTPFDPPATGVTPSVLLPHGTDTVTLTVDDGKGGTSMDTVDVTVADTTAPVTSATINGTAGNNGWYVSDVSVSLTATDSCAGAGEIHYTVNGTETVVTGSSTAISLASDGTYDITYWAVDNAGNVEAPHTMSVKEDKTAPVITVTGITEGTKYPACTPPTPDFSVTDATSGVSTSSADLTGGNSNGVGTFTYTVTATDAAGNTATTSVTYKVVYTFGGFETPLTLDRPFRLGSTIPVKFALTDGCGAYVDNATATLTLQLLSGSEPVGDPIDGSTDVPDSGNVFRYDLTDNHYIYNLDTNTLSVGSWKATATLDDGETYSINIAIK